MPASPLPLLIADDTEWTLGELAAAWHQYFQFQVITVLGSNGKTTIKELIAGVFRQQAGEAILVTPLHYQLHWKLWLSCRVKKIVALGNMAELGSDSEIWHLWAGRMARLMRVDELFTMGDLAANAATSFGNGAQHLADGHALVETLLPRLHAGVTVLVKGSRCMAMENIVSQLG